MNAKTQTHETHSLSPSTRFALEYLGALTGDATDAPHPHRVSDTSIREVLEFSHEIDSAEEQLLVLDGLYHLAKDSEPLRREIEAAEDRMYGNGLIELTSLEGFSRAARRVLNGKNTALVVRAGTWGDDRRRISHKIVDLLSPIGEFDKVGQERFPKATAKWVEGSSWLHLDNFIYDDEKKSGFRFTLSASQLETGSALFIGGPASRRARNTQPKNEGVAHPYEQALIKLEQDPRIQHLYTIAASGQLKGLRSDFVAEGQHMTAVVLKPGDTVLWAQGGPGSDAASWHAFRQIGQEPRVSTSYHYVQNL